MTNVPDSARPGWPPRTESELSEALLGGLLEETHFLDVKRELASGRSANTELARDLAQFGIDGGVLVIGVDEGDSSTLTLSPVATKGLCERIEQVAHMKVVPPLHVACHVIPSADETGNGYVWVNVPASSLAPHMVDHVYYGRGDKTRHKLDDPQVERLHLARNESVDRADELLDAWVARDPYLGDQRVTAHLYMVLEPVSPRLDMAGDLLGDKVLRDLVGLAARSVSDQLGLEQAPPAQQYLAWGLADDRYKCFRRPSGAALSTRWTSTKEPITDVADDWEVELTDGGGVRVLHTGLGSVQQKLEEHVLAPAALVVVRQAISIAAAVATRTGYNGRWLAGIEVNGTTGARLPSDNWGLSVGPSFYNEPIAAGQGDSRRTRMVTMYELQYTPWVVAGDLLGRITRGLGVSDLDVVKRMLAAPTSDPVGGAG